MDRSTRLVAEAVALAVRRKIRGAKADNPDALAETVRRRLSGTWGAELRRRADASPELNAEHLVAIVMSAIEFPADTSLADLATRWESGARDRARKASYGPYAEDLPVAQSLSDHIAELRDRVKLGAEAMESRDHRPPEHAEPELTIVPPNVRDALDAGKTANAQARKARRERAMTEGAK